MHLEIWTEKYRPKTLDEVVDQKHVVSRLKAWVKSGSVPHMLFAGPAGVGKTTIALCLAKELFGSNWKSNFQETNASVTPETPIVIKEDGKTKRTNFGYLGKYFKGGEKYARANNIKILSIDKNQKPAFKKISLISRHKVDKIAEIKYEGGFVRTSLNHSVIVLNNEGELASKKVEEMNKGDHLITFCEAMSSENPEIDFIKYKPQEMTILRGGTFKNPKLKIILDKKRLNQDLSWLFGMYLAEGCAHIMKRGTSGSVIFTVSSKEDQIAKSLQKVMQNEFGLDSTSKLASSGFDRTRMTSIQVRTYNTQMAKFFLDNFYNGSETKNARSKRVPPFMFESDIDCRTAFLKGYMGDACGEWDNFLRYSSKSSENLIDVAWLGRMTGMDTSVFEEKARIVWKLPSYSYIKSEFVPSEPLRELLKGLKLRDGVNYRYLLRHQLYSKKSGRVSKNLADKILKNLSRKIKDERIVNLLRFVESPLSVVRIKSIKVRDYYSYVYDVSVPGSEMFWGGAAPVLLHNSDERGINIVRGRVKEFARMKSMGSDFKIVFLDESDALTPEAQQALRRTMERFSDSCRFILSCNYSSRIIEPIQSRTSVFRFKRLAKESVKEYMKRIAAGEKLSVSDDALDAIFEISEGDLRKATNILQSSSAMGKVTKETVYDAAAQSKPEDIRNMIESAMAGKFFDARKKLYELLITQGLSGEDVIKGIHREVFDLKVPEEKKIKLVEQIGEFEFRLNQGGSPEIQLEALLAQFMKQGK
jgi:replication factor C small subunit